MHKSIVVAASLALGGCGLDSTSGSDSSMQVSTPTVLLQTRAIDRTQVRPVVTLSNGQSVTMSRLDDGSGAWTGTVSVPTDQSYVVTVLWVESIQSRELQLLRLDQTISVTPNDSVFTLDASRYSKNLDDDGDGTTNLDERIADTDPFTHEGNQPTEDQPNPDNPTPVNPTEPVTPSVPTTPTQPPTPSVPTTPTDPVEPATPVEPTTPTTPVEPTTPTTPVEPTTPTTPVAPTDPVEPTTPTTPVAPTDPVEPTTPTTPVAPTDPVEPPTPTTPVAPTDPVEPTTPTTPLEPTDPVEPTIDLFIPRIAESLAPDIDGLDVTVDNNGLFTGEWASAVYLGTSGAPLRISNLMIDQDTNEGNAINFRKWAAMHDGEYLYIVVTVEDDGARYRDSGTTVWQDDSLELFIDGNNSKLTSYDGVDDYQFTFPVRGSSGSKQAVTSGEVKGEFNPSSADIDFATGPGVGPDGLRRPRYEQDVYEIRIKLDSVGIAVNQPFGLELQINDDDDGELRDGKWGWHHPQRVNADVDETFLNPSFMGTARLD